MGDSRLNIFKLRSQLLPQSLLNHRSVFFLTSPHRVLNPAIGKILAVRLGASTRTMNNGACANFSRASKNSICCADNSTIELSRELAVTHATKGHMLI